VEPVVENAVAVVVAIVENAVDVVVVLVLDAIEIAVSVLDSVENAVVVGVKMNYYQNK
jgi:hypothetical protein